MSTVIDLPSGAKLEVRSLTGKESKILSDKEAIKSGLFLDKILKACTVGVLDWGPYASEESGEFDWGKALVGDRFYGLLQIRVISLGETYQFKLQCAEEGCRERFGFELNLLTDLPVKRLSEEAKGLFQAGNVFQTKDTNGKTVSFRLPIGKDEQAASKFNTFDGALIQGLSQRIVAIDDVESKRIYLEGLAWKDLLKLLDDLDEPNCGVKTDIEVPCPHCGTIQDVQLPFGRGFLLPSTLSSRKSPET
jgi:hypothetical protein